MFQKLALSKGFSFVFPILVLVCLSTFCAKSAQAQLFGRFAADDTPPNHYDNSRFGMDPRRAVNTKVEPTPEIQGADKNTRFTSFDDFDIFKSDDAQPNAGISGAPAIVNQSIADIVQGITERDLSTRYNVWRAYLANALRNTEGVRSGSELNGLGRLSWYKSIMADPLKGAGEAEEFTRLLHTNFCSGRNGFCQGVKRIAGRMDVNAAEIKIPAAFKKGSAQSALNALERALEEALLAHGKAIAPLSQEQLRLISNYAHQTLTIQASVGHTVSRRGSGKQQVLAMLKIDQSAMYSGLMQLSLLMEADFVKSLDGMAESSSELTFEGVTGKIEKIIETQAGTIIVGGRGANTYDIEKMANVSAIIDLAGNDTYLEGAVNINRPILAILDIHGDDTYKGSLPGIQGSCLLGISILVDAEGDDQYLAKNHAQGSAIAGACALVDFAGNDTYDGVRRVQGTALAGIGLLIDRRGSDKYHAAMWSQGTGQTLGCGVLEDCTGNDTYYTGGLYYDSYPETPGYEGWGQGLGSGIRGVAAGGIGVLLEGSGNDVYEFDYIAHGGGYWMGLGFFRDFAGDDRHEGATKVMWNGTPRRESRFQRFSSGFGCHYAAGFFFEDAGDDYYWASIMSQGFAWDAGVAFSYDFLGNDTIVATGGGNQGQGAQASIGVMVNFSGNDIYRASTQGYASSEISYHPLPNCGGNFSFLIDYGGTDTYGCRAKNNAKTRRGMLGGFLIDRPTKAESLAPPKEPETPAPATRPAQRRYYN